MRRIHLLAFALATLPWASAQAEPAIVFEGARLIDGTGQPPRENSVLVIEGDRITAIGTAGELSHPKGARVMDVHGRTLMPGLISSHSHVGLVLDGKNSADAYTRENVKSQLLQYEQYGVTSILSLGINRDLGYELRDEQRRGTFPGASIFTAGRGIGVPDGVPPLPCAPDQLCRSRTPEEAVANVDAMAAHHPDIIKLWLDDDFGKFPKMKPEVYQAVIQEAHRKGLRVAAHVFYLADAKALIAAGVDALAHSIRDQDVDSELIQAMKSRGVFYIPTLTRDESLFIFAEKPSLAQEAFFADAFGSSALAQVRSQAYKDKIQADPNTVKNKASVATGMRNLKALHDAGVSIAFGTDSGAGPTRPGGCMEHRELELMVRSGLTPMDAIVAATRGSASFIGTSDRGTLEKGKRADFLILAANPLDDIRNTRQLVSIWHGGRETKPRVAVSALK